jgi:hypothetical protein
LLALVAASPAMGCGHCVEDKVAAVYDHGLITKALGEHHQVVFFGIEGILPAGDEGRRVIAAALGAPKGVDSRSLRISVEPASLSLSFDGRRISSDQILDMLNRKLELRGLSVSLLKVMDQRAATR